MAERNSGHPRDPLDFYVEPASVVHSLLNVVAFTGPIHDPCCGVGTVVKAAWERGIHASGADIVQRAPQFELQDFFSDQRPRSNVVTNPPFRESMRIIEHAKQVVLPRGIIAILAQAKFLFSQARIDLFEDCERVIILSRRPSMPTGAALAEHGEAIRGGGSLDYLWCIWRAGTIGPTSCRIDWVI
jgi:hypothetical protein